MKIKGMNKVLLGLGIIGACLLIATVRPSTADNGAAATQQGQRQRGAHLLKHLTKALGLSSDQQSQVAAILGDAKAKLQGLRADKSLTRTQRHAQAKTIIESGIAAIRSDLTSDQQTKFDQMVAARRARWQERRQGE